MINKLLSFLLAVFIAVPAFADTNIRECFYNYDCAQTRSDSWCQERTGYSNAICSAECGLFCAIPEDGGDDPGGACSGEAFTGDFDDGYSYTPGDRCGCNGERVLDCPTDQSYSDCSKYDSLSCVLPRSDRKRICGRGTTIGVPNSHLCSLCGVSNEPTTTTTSASTYINQTVTTTCSVSAWVVSSNTSSPSYSCKSNAYGVATSATAGCYKCPDNATCNGGTTFTCNAGWYKSGDTCTQCGGDSSWVDAGNYRVTRTHTNGDCSTQTQYGCQAGARCITNCDISNSNLTCGACMNNATCNQNTGHTDSSFTCNSGFYWNGSMCADCPANATCTSTGFECNAGFYWNGSMCANCPANATCTPMGFSCVAGYYKDGNGCAQCPTATKTYNDETGADIIRGTSDAGATSISDCFVSTGTYWDDRGLKTISASCAYNSTQHNM